MLKKDLVDAVYNRVNAEHIESNKLKSIVLTKGRIEEVADAIFEEIKEAVANGKKVKIVGHGTYEKKFVKGREGTCRVGIRKGEPWKTEDSYKPAFDASQMFYDRVNGINGGNE